MRRSRPTLKERGPRLLPPRPAHTIAVFGLCGRSWVRLPFDRLRNISGFQVAAHEQEFVAESRPRARGSKGADARFPCDPNQAFSQGGGLGRGREPSYAKLCRRCFSRDKARPLGDRGLRSPPSLEDRLLPEGARLAQAPPAPGHIDDAPLWGGARCRARPHRPCLGDSPRRADHRRGGGGRLHLPCHLPSRRAALIRR